MNLSKNLKKQPEKNSLMKNQEKNPQTTQRADSNRVRGDADVERKA